MAKININDKKNKTQSHKNTMSIKKINGTLLLILRLIFDIEIVN